MKTQVYFIQAGENGPIKIGVTSGSVAHRRDSLQIGSPVALTLLGSMRGGRARERRLHRRLAEHRIRGEWFKPSPEVAAVIASLDPMPTRAVNSPTNPKLKCAFDLVRKCGGHQAVAEMLNVDVSRVYRFTYPKSRGGTGGIIAAWHQQRLFDLARSRGIDLNAQDFFPGAA